MKFKIFHSSLTIVFAIASITGCKKYVHQNINAASNSSLAIVRYNDVFSQLNQALSYEVDLDQMTNGSWNLHGTVCADVMLEPLGSGFPKTLTIDYGAGCIGADGVSRSGKVIAVFDGNFRTEGTSFWVSFEDFTSGQYAIAGTDSIYNNGTDGDGDPLFNHAIENGVVSWGGQQITWEADLVRTWAEGSATNYTTPDTSGTIGIEALLDDVFELTGTAVGNDGNGHPYSWSTNTPLQVQTGCDYVQAGTSTVSPINFHEGLIDYGNGECDSHAVIEVNGEVFNFTQ